MERAGTRKRQKAKQVPAPPRNKMMTRSARNKHVVNFPEGGKGGRA